MSYQAEYIWIDGTEPSPLMRCKTKIVADGKEPPIWGFDGSSTNQAPGKASDCVLRPVLVLPDPLRGGKNVLVLRGMRIRQDITAVALTEVSVCLALLGMWR